MRIRIVVAALCAGLLLAVGLPLALGASGERTKTLAAAMNGKKEVDASGKKNAGDLNGLGGFTAIVDNGKLCFGITVRGLDAPVAAHIHRGGPKVMGPVVLPLTQPTAGDPGASSACVDVQGPLASELLKTPSRFYVNVHTATFPNGAIRGQLKTQK
ncbi:MAG: hypothetical protein QOJ12_1964 [Thermoleophilales bacterium]|nr:hypothetical protein [Thermoleophilales bacterium]